MEPVDILKDDILNEFFFVSLSFIYMDNQELCLLSSYFVMVLYVKNAVDIWPGCNTR